MDLSRGRLESTLETFPIVEGWVTTVHPDRRQAQASNLPFPDRRRPIKRSTPAKPEATWVAVGHFTVRATETSENLSVDRAKLFLVVQGIRFEVVYMKPIYVDSRNHKYIYSATKTQRWSFVALCVPSPAQLRMMPTSASTPVPGAKPKTVLGRPLVPTPSNPIPQGNAITPRAMRAPDNAPPAQPVPRAPEAPSLPTASKPKDEKQDIVDFLSSMLDNG